MISTEMSDLPKHEDGKNYDQEPVFMYKNPTFFGGPPREHNITFCIDTSGSMYGCLDVVKESVIEVLHQHAASGGENMFNLIEFSTDIVQWADRMVKCIPETVHVATQWIMALKPKTGTNTVDAVVAAFADPECKSVYLITDSLPDQLVDRAIDAILVAAGARPVHCFYIQGSKPETAVVDFLHEVAVETYGSLHIITVVHHGAVNRVAPIYRADMGAGRIIRSTSGNIFSANQKTCSVMTALSTGDSGIISHSPMAIFPPGIMHSYGGYSGPHNLPMPPHPYCLFPWPYRYYCFYASPAYGWSRYRPAKAWLNHAKSFVDSLATMVPSAGSMLIGVRVLARRHSNGLFYLGNVKSQSLHNKFLIEFGPCKHGKYKDTEYQETFVYDIVSHNDALRHPVLVEDRVIAPWEPEGESYAPGIVIDGQEKRIVEGDGPDKQLVVTFYNGKTASVEKDKAVWIPRDLHERIVYELNLSKNIRKELAQNDFYPMENLPGYPTSGPKAFPTEFPCYIQPGWVESNGRLRADQSSLWNTSPQPRTCHIIPKSVSVKTEDVEQVIPGTLMTRSQLNEKVMSQIQANSNLVSGSSNASHLQGCLKESDVVADDFGPKNSHTRGSLRENNGITGGDAGSKNGSFSEDHFAGSLHDGRNSLDHSGLKKSVSFADLCSKLDTNDGDFKDSGHRSQTDLYFSDDENFDPYGSGSLKKHDAASTTDLSLLYPRQSRRSQSAGGRKPWKYWKNDPSPSVLEPMHYGPFRIGPYRDSMDMPLLLRDAKRGQYGVEWTSPLTQMVDQWAKYRRRPTVYDSLYVPKPPEYQSDKQRPGRDLCEILGEHQRPQETLADARRDFRQRQVLEREIGWQRQAAEADYNQQQMLKLRRQQVRSHLDYDLQRHSEEQEKMQHHLDARHLNQQRRLQAVRDGLEEKERKEADRLIYKSMQRENRIFESAQRNLEKQETAAKRQATKEMQHVVRAHTIAAKTMDDECQLSNHFAQKQHAHSSHIAYFNYKENEAQKRKQLVDKVTDDAKAINRSYILA